MCSLNPEVVTDFYFYLNIHTVTLPCWVILLPVRPHQESLLCFSSSAAFCVSQLKVQYVKTNQHDSDSQQTGRISAG